MSDGVTVEVVTLPVSEELAEALAYWRAKAIEEVGEAVLEAELRCQMDLALYGYVWRSSIDALAAALADRPDVLAGRCRGGPPAEDVDAP
jgi:hypothetical protein